MTFQHKLNAITQKNNSHVCIGLDSDLEKLPEFIKSREYPQFQFNKAIIDATFDLVCAYKPNTAFYEALGERGVRELKMTCDYIHEKYPDIPIILDAKRADIGNTNFGYVKYCFDYLRSDALTLHPYLGEEALRPFLDLADKGIFVLCKTSNPGSGEFQDIYVIPNKGGNQSDPSATSQTDKANSEPLYKYICKKVVNSWNQKGNCMLVVGATYPEEMADIRRAAGDMTFLIPGIGPQGGDLEKTVKAGLNSQKAGIIINSARAIIFASNGQDFAQKARQEAANLRDEINKYKV